MPEDRIKDFRLLPDPEVGQGYHTFQALSPDNQPLRFILFDDAVSASAAFRAAFRKDQPRLSRINHPHILCPITWGEHEGRLYYVTEPAPDLSLRQFLSGNRASSWDELIDISWQVASAIQHLHNLGLSAGQLDADSIGVTESLRNTLMTVGIPKWIAASHSEPDLFDSRTNADMAADLRQMGDLLLFLSERCTAATTEDESEAKSAEFLSLATQLREPTCHLAARDIQGLLGDMLLEQSDGSMEFRDQRQSDAPRRSAIMDDLFDDAGDESELPRHETAPPGKHRALMVGLILLTLGVLAIIYKVTAR